MSIDRDKVRALIYHLLFFELPVPMMRNVVAAAKDSRTRAMMSQGDAELWKEAERLAKELED